MSKKDKERNGSVKGFHDTASPLQGLNADEVEAFVEEALEKCIRKIDLTGSKLHDALERYEHFQQSRGEE